MNGKEWGILIGSLVLLSTLELAVFYLIKAYQRDHKYIGYVILAMYLYGCIPLVLLFVLEYGGDDSIGRLNATWNVLSTSYGVVLDRLVFNTKFSTSSIIGVLIGISSMILINTNPF
jgi:hypothetical protein